MVGIIGYIIAMSTMNLAARYVSLWVPVILDPFLRLTTFSFGYMQILDGIHVQRLCRNHDLGEQLYSASAGETRGSGRFRKLLFAVG